MEALYIRQPSEEKAEDGVVMMEGEEGEREKSKAHEEEGTEASYFKVSSSDEEMDEDSEPPPPVNRKKVAFADALGLDLVTVMEFEAPEIEVSEVSQPPESNASHTAEEIYYMSCLFTVQSSEEELDQRLREQSVELESIELLPGTTTLRGTVTVVNLCYGKSVHVRMTLDCWASYFELCAEYVPGSSDKKTDRFAFKYTMVPPFEKEGSRLEFCLRYETSVGTFWANNKGMNYVLFCHRKQHVKEQVGEERSSYKSRGSCLKSSRRRKSWENSNTARFIAEEEARHRAEEAGRKSEDRAETLLYPDKPRPSAASIKSRLRATRLASVHLAQKRQQVPQVDQPLPAPWHDSASCLYEQQEKQPNKSVQVLTYHQIPLLTLDWNNDKSQQWGAAADVEDIWTGRPKMTSSKASAEYIDEKPCVDDMWETFHNATDNTTDKEASVCEVWQAFLNEPSCTDHSGVPESEWLQTAASVSPSNDKEPKAQYGAGSSHVHEFQVGTDTAITSTSTYTTLHTSAACQLLSDTGGTSPANVAMKTIEHQQQPAEARVSGGPGDDIAATQDAASPQRSQTNSETDTAGECSPRGLAPVSEDSAAVDSSSVCREHAAWEHAASGEIIGAIGRDEPGFIPHTADLVTSSGESETTDMTATPQSQNASATDRISQGARPEEALSSSRGGGEVTGTLHNATDDTLAFRGTIRQGTKDGERFVFYSTSTREVKEGIMAAANKVSVSAGEEEIFRPQETEECEISPRYDADEKQREEFRPNHNSGSPLRERESDGDEIRAPQQSQADEFDPNQTCKDNFKQSQITPSEFKSDESENKDDVSNDKDLAKSRKTDSEPFCCTTKDETKILIGAEAGIIQMLNEDTRKENDKALKLSSQGLNEQCGPIGAGEELCIREKEQDDSTLTETQEHVALKRETGEEQQPSSPRTRHTEESWEMTKKDFRSDHRDPFRPFPTDKCNRKPSKAVERRWSHSRDDIMKGHEEDLGAEISAGEVFTAGENVAERSTPTELQKQPEILERTEEDMSHKDRDERVSIGKMKIDAPGELMMGSLENPQGERENAPAQLRERELSAAVESPPRVVECETLSEGTEDAITAESTGALGVIESELVERFGEDLVMGIWKDLFGERVQASHRDTNIVGLMEGALSDRPDVTLDRNLLAETAFDDAFDSGVFSLIELPDTDTNPSLCQGLQQQQTLASESNERSPKQRSQSPITGQETDCFSEPQTHSNSSAHFSGGLDPVLVDQSRPLLTGKSSPRDEENYTQIKQRSVAHQEPDRQIEDCVVIPHKKESLNPSASHKHSSSPSEKSKESGGFAWWTLFYILGHITRLVICGLLVTGFFFIVYLYDFPLFLALYMFSLCWWFSKWKSHRAATTDKGTLPGKA